MRRFLHLPTALFLCAAPGLAQDIYYVDPVAGDDNNNGGVGAPWKTVTKAMTVVSSGDFVELKDGVFDSANESYPIVLVDGVDIYYPGSDHAAVFDAGGTTSAFRVTSSFSDGAGLSGMTIRQCTIGVDVISGGGATTAALDVDDCLFESFSVAGVRAIFDTAGTHLLWVRNSAFSPSSAPHGVRVQVQGASAVLGLSVVRDNTITNCATGIAIEASDGGTILDTTELRGNDVSGATTANLQISASASASRDAANAALVHSNRISSGTVGLLIEATSTQGRDAVCDGDIDFNWLSGNATNVVLNTTNNGFSGADLSCAFTGNLIVNATGDGMVCNVASPRTGGVNCLPDLGTASAGTGRNTFKGNGGFNLVLDADMVNYLSLLNLMQAEGNFWTQASLFAARSTIDFATVSETLLDLDPVLLDTLSASMSPNRIPENSVRTVTVRARNSGTAFVDNDDDDASINQMVVAVRKGATTITVTPQVFQDGSGFTFDTPELAEQGTWHLDIALPGGQAGTITFRVSEVGGGGGSSTGCFVATAAHGDYDAREVRVLRRFRDDYLLANEAGRSAVRAYYEHGPAAAEWIEDREWARGGARVLLAVPVVLAEAMLRWSAAQRLAVAVLMLGGLFWLRRRR